MTRLPPPAGSDAPAPGRRWLLPSAALGRTPGATADRPAAAEATEQTRHGFRIGDRGLLLDARRSGEYLGQPSIFPVPNTADWFAGLVNLRGNLVPVFDLQRLIDPGSEAAGPPRVLVLDRGERAIGLRVEGPPRNVRPGRALEQPPAVEPPLDAHLRAVYRVGDQLWLDVDLAALVLAHRQQIDC